MKKILAAVLCMGLSLLSVTGIPLTASAEQSDLTYKFYAADEVLEIGYDNERISSSTPFYTVTGGNTQNAVIPAEYDDGTNGKHKVIAIENNAFYMGDVKTVDLSGATNLKFIGSFAFADTALAGQITLPNTVELVGGSAFKATDITSVTLGAALKEIEQNAFALCSKLDVTLTLPDALKEIGESAFKQSAIKGLTLNATSTLEKIGDYAFDGCALAGEILLPETMASIGRNVFTSTALEKIIFLSEKAITVGAQTFPTETELSFISQTGLDACKAEKCWEEYSGKMKYDASLTYAVNVAETQNGNVFISSASVKKYGKLTLTVKPAKGYDLDVLKINGQEITPTLSGNQYTYTLVVMEEINIEATFKKGEMPDDSSSDTTPAESTSQKPAKKKGCRSSVGSVCTSLILLSSAMVIGKKRRNK